MIIFDPVRGKHLESETWLSAHKLLDTVIVCLSFLHGLWFIRNQPDDAIAALSLVPLFLLSAIDLISLHFRQRFWINGWILPICIMLMVFFMLSILELFIPNWIMICVFASVMRMPQQSARIITATLLIVSLAILHFRWQSDNITLARAIIPAILILILTRIFFKANAISVEKLDHTSDLLKSALQTMSQGICVIDKNGRYKLFNQQACDLLDLPRKLLETHPLLSEIVQFQKDRGDFGEDFSEVEPSARAYVASLGANTHESAPNLYLRKDSKGRYIEVRSQLMPSGDMVRTYSDVTAYQNINNELQRLLSEEKQHVDKLQQITSDLNQANLRFNTAADSLPGALYELKQHLDGKTEVTYFNTKMSEIIEVENAELNQNPLLFYSCIHPDDRYKLTLASEGSNQDSGDLFTEVRINTPGGKTKWIQLSYALQITNDLSISIWSGYAIDVTERIDLQAKAIELKVANEQNQLIKKLLQEKEDLIASLLIANRTAETGAMSAALAHELNQPLCAIGLHTEVLQHKLDQTADPETREILSFIAEDNKRASDIISALRRIFRQETTNSQTLNLNELIKSLQPIYQPQSVAKNITFKYDLCMNSQIEINPNEFQQVIINLLNNSIASFDACQDKKDKTITIQTLRSEKTLSLIVSDNGTGIPPEVAPKLFSLFKTSSKSGMGLGSWLSKHIVEQHGGTIHFENIPSGGVRFIVELPIKQ